MAKFRALAMIGLARDMNVLIDRFASKETDGAFPSCLSCKHFQEVHEACMISNYARPPARIIAFGCHQYQDKDDIPF